MNQIIPDRIIILYPNHAHKLIRTAVQVHVKHLLSTHWEEVSSRKVGAPSVSLEERIVRLVLEHRKIALEQALGWCESQVYDLEASKRDEYRRGQRRGSQDCVHVVSQLLQDEPPVEVLK